MFAQKPLSLRESALVVAVIAAGLAALRQFGLSFVPPTIGSVPPIHLLFVGICSVGGAVFYTVARGAKIGASSAIAIALPCAILVSIAIIMVLIPW